MTLTLAFSAAAIEWSEVRANKSEQTSICPGKDFMDQMLSAIHRGKQAFKHLMPIGERARLACYGRRLADHSSRLFDVRR